MPLEQNIRNTINDYCKRDLPGDIDWHIDQFSFIDDIDLKNKLGRAYYSARYMSKLMEATYASGDEIHPFVKFQIIQYASIYEAVTSYLLWNKFSEHEEVKALQIHKAYKPVSALGSLTNLKYDGTDLFTCLYKDTKTPRNSIPFKDRVDCAVRIGFIDEAYSEDIKNLYRLRNLAHIETEARTLEEIELEDSKKGYWRIKPFLEAITEFLKE
jgi:hypothetical protein